MEWQVSDLEFSKKLKELGVKQESLWYWVCSYTKTTDGGVPMFETGKVRRGLYGTEHYWTCSAFTVAELGEMIPNGFGFHTGRDALSENHGEEKRWLGFVYGEWFFADTEANARAKMLIHLIEQGVVSVEKINGRMG